MANPTGPTAAPIRRTMTAKVQVRAPVPKNLTLKVWNWIYSPKTGSSGCDTQFDQKVTIRAPFWVGGNLCLNNNANVQAPLYVGGWVSLMNPGAAIGSSTNKVEAVVRGGCQWQNQPFYKPCLQRHRGERHRREDERLGAPGAPGTRTPRRCPRASRTSRRRSSAGARATAPGDPVGGWYSAASPGPKHPCEVSSRTAVPTFDNNGVINPPPANGSVPGLFNLTPDNVSYTCRTVNGELSWNARPGSSRSGRDLLRRQRDATTTGNRPMTYTGWGQRRRRDTKDGACQAVIFPCGDISIGSEKLCAKLNAAGRLRLGDRRPQRLGPEQEDAHLRLARGRGGNVGANKGIAVDGRRRRRSRAASTRLNRRHRSGRDGRRARSSRARRRSWSASSSAAPSRRSASLPFSIQQPPGAVLDQPADGLQATAAGARQTLKGRRAAVDNREDGAFLATLVFVPGLALGSFLGVAAARVPLRRSIVRPGSACMSCDAPIRWYDNVPLFSYALLRGRCRRCGVRIPPRDLAIELATSLLLVGCVLAFGFTVKAAAAAVCCGALVVVTATDLERRIIPNRVVLPAAAAVLVLRTVADPSPRGRSARSAPPGSCSSPRSPIRAGWAWETSSSRS